MAGQAPRSQISIWASQHRAPVGTLGIQRDCMRSTRDRKRLLQELFGDVHTEGPPFFVCALAFAI